ncbi:sulfotransferase domain-containing protein [Candidatus Pelagibacter sp. HIMB1746]|uniref:sulfotransferase domain-containing protein n=1 Tax=Candidatus Pelagibacter sp. HIMB1746 TaxID=3413370 RepID=UPI003F837C89
MIIWLASYPKSGNTLMRSILSSYFYSKDGNFEFKNLNQIKQFPMSVDFMSLGIDIENDKEVFKNFINVQKFINEKKRSLSFFKTHSSLVKMYDCDFTNLENSLAAIYIVRDPRNVVTSFANHNGISVDEATDIILDQNMFTDKSSNICKVLVGSWASNYNSWKEFKKKNKYILIKYEDLISKKKTVLIRVFKFLNQVGFSHNLNIIKLNKAIKTTEFNLMKSKEEKESFSEALPDKETGKRRVFFNLGPKNDWRKILDKKNIEKIEKHFKDEMLELGYL